MATSIKGTRTEKNLVAAYMAESAAYSRYTFYAGQAEKESYFPIQKVFEETAANELRHGKIFFKFLEGGSVTVPLAVDAGVIGTTAENLATAAEEELVEGSEMYTEAARVAQEEGFTEIAEHFSAIAKIEESHRRRFLYYLKQVKDGTVWKRDHEITWKCLVCGYEFVGTEPPVKCPACDHPREHYMAMDYVEGLE
ncbi:MAG: rubrerythrin family protein [Bacteroidales bacterium]|nr:rubrerythrin family protein [Bacteroidales bacterium]MBD5215211.1 rubrerythrin family protein [Bacteroidales bacterium]MBD5219085.1 rubrerythrin family protein [Bacteroidales bacterium]